MKKFIFLLATLAIAASCSNSSSGGNSGPNPAQPRPDNKPSTGEENNNQGVIPPTTGPSAPVLQREDIKNVKAVFGSKINEANAYISKASTLKSQLAPNGNQISLNDCKTLQEKISSNYHLHYYSEAGDNQQHKGIQICPEEASSDEMVVFKGEWVVPKTFKFYTMKTNQSQLGLSVAGVIAVEYNLYSYPTKVIHQYFYDSKFRFIEYVSSRQEKRDNAYHEFFVEVASLTQEGHVLGNVFKLWADPSQKYLWKKSATFVPVNGNGVTASTYVQNDGSGREVAISNYRIPDSWAWQDYEVSPATRIWGIYSVNGSLFGFPEKQYSYSFFTGPQQCEEGIQGYDSSGNYIRVFGDDNCSKKLDVQTTSH